MRTLFLLLFLASSSSAQAPDLEQMDLVLKSVPDGPVAKVAGANIGKDEFIRLYQAELMRASQVSGKEIPEGSRVTLAMWCIGTLVEQEVLFQEARKQAVSVDAEVTEKAWASQVEQFRQRLSREGVPELSEADVIRNLGFASREDVLAEVERGLAIEQMRGRIVRESGLTVSDEDVAKIYEEERDRYKRPGAMHLRQIFIRASDNGSKARQQRADARSRAEDAHSRIQAGQSFQGLIRTVSEAPGKDTGGDIGPAPIDQLPPFLVEPALTMAPGEVSGVIESEYGFHIIQLVEITPGVDVTLERAAPVIERRLLAERGAELVHDYCDKLLREDYEVQVFLELAKTLLLNPDYAELRLE